MRIAVTIYYFLAIATLVTGIIFGVIKDYGPTSHDCFTIGFAFFVIALTLETQDKIDSLKKTLSKKESAEEKKDTPT